MNIDRNIPTDEVTTAPTTPEAALDLFVSLLHEPEVDVIPAGTPFVSVYGNGGLNVSLRGADHDVSTHPGGRHHRLTFRPLTASDLDPVPGWKALADVIREQTSNSDPDELAKALWESGVRI